MHVPASQRMSFQVYMLFALLWRTLKKKLSAETPQQYANEAIIEPDGHVAISKTGFYLSHQFVLFLAIMVLVMVGGALWWGHKIANAHLIKTEGVFSGQWRHYLQVDRAHLKDLELHTQHQLAVVTQHLGQVEANLARVNALATKVIALAKLPEQEFALSPLDSKVAMIEAGGEILPPLQSLGAELHRQYAQMAAIHQAMQIRLSQQDLALSGAAKPSVAKGRISSYFGPRKDPIHGRKAFHAGVDIVGKEGTPVKALASGIVTFADKKGAYGRLIEIKHQNGLSTRYGHNKQLLVKQGQLVKKGEPIALLGSSGRATGAHLHLEVRKDGRAVDPGLYFTDLARK